MAAILSSVCVCGVCVCVWGGGGGVNIHYCLIITDAL